ncbi:MAG: GvpL/GvpF family gas vesicle protein [Pseudorhodobacter sp.]|nr:GvpL/GvpF family gas vesicle protein [Pseudorhodobacter sp.]
MTATSIVYVYGVLANWSDLVLDLPPGDLAGIAERGPLRVLPRGDIAALVCDLVLPDGRDLEAILEDSQSAQRLILNHHLVLAGVVGRHTILPLRFGAVFTGDAGVIAALDECATAFQQAIGRIDGALEWGVKAFCDRDLLGQRLAGTVAGIRELESEIANKGEGSAFFLRRRLERLTLDEVENRLNQCLAETQGRLKPLVLEGTSVKLQPPAVHGHAHDMVANRSYLIARAAEAAFMQALDVLRAAHAPFGLEYQTNGPWPAYSFSDQQLGGSANG